MKMMNRNHRNTSQKTPNEAKRPRHQIDKAERGQRPNIESKSDESSAVRSVIQKDTEAFRQKSCSGFDNYHAEYVKIVVLPKEVEVSRRDHVAKTLEKRYLPIILVEIHQHIEKFGVLPKEQFGIRRRHFTEHNIRRLVEYNIDGLIGYLRVPTDKFRNQKGIFLLLFLKQHQFTAISQQEFLNTEQ